MLAEALFAAFEAGDAEAVRGLCASDFVARQNNSPRMDLDTVLGFSAAVLGVVEHFRYEDAVRSETSSGFVEEHRVRGTLPDGTELDLAVCVVADVRNGKVSHLREYVDGVAAAPLLDALQ